MSVYDTEIRSRQSAYKKAQDKKVALLSDSAKMDKYVSGISQQLSPTMKMAPKSKADLLVDRVDRSINDDSPMKGLGSELRRRLTNELANPANANYSLNNIATGVTKSLLEEKDDKGQTRLERAYKDYRLEESNRDWIFFSGKSEKAKPPMALKGMPTYKEWKEKKRAEEDLTVPQTFREKAADLAVATYVGGVFGVGVGTVGGPAGTVTGGVVGALSAAAANLATLPIKAALGHTEWYRARADSDSWVDNLAAGTVKYGPEALATLGLEKGANVAIKSFAAARQAAIAKPSVQKLLEYKGATDTLNKTAATVEKKAVNFSEKPLNMRKRDGVVHVDRWAKSTKSDLPRAEKVELGKRYGELSLEGQAKANAHPDGLAKGIVVEHEKEVALGYSSGVKSADKDIAKKTAKKTITKSKPVETAKEAKVKEVQAKVEATAETPKPEVVTSIPITAKQINPAVDFILRQQDQAIRNTPVGKEVMEIVGKNTQNERFLIGAQNVDNVIPELKVLEGGDDIVTGIHHGSYRGGPISDELLGTGEGMQMLGPGLHFSTDPVIANKYYSKYGKATEIDVKLNELYDPVKGPRHPGMDDIMKEAGLDTSAKIDAARMKSISTKHGRGDIGTVVSHIGPKKARALFVKHGLKGAKEKLPSGSYEIAIYDDSLLPAGQKVSGSATPTEGQLKINQDAVDKKQVTRITPKTDITYHTTNEQALNKIKNTGLRKNTALSTDEISADKWKSIKGNVVLRVKGEVRDGTYANTKKLIDTVLPENIEVKTGTGWEPLIKSKTDPYDFPMAFDKSDHAYIPVKNKDFESVLTNGIEGGKFVGSAEDVSKLRQGTNQFRVKKEAVGIEVKGKKTVTSKTKFSPDDLEYNNKVRLDDGSFQDNWIPVKDYNKLRDVEKVYDEIGNYYDNLIVKYNPDLYVPPKTGKLTSADLAMEAKLTKASYKIEEKMTKAELTKLNNMVAEYEGVEQAVEHLKTVIPDIGVEELRGGMAQTIKAITENNLSIGEGLKQVESFITRVEHSATMAGSDKNNLLGPMREYVASLSKRDAIIKGFVAFGIGAPLLESLNADTAEASLAGTLSTVAVDALKAASTKTIKAFQSARLAVPKIVTDDVFHIPVKGFQVGLSETKNGGAKAFTANVGNIVRGNTKRLRHSAMTPQMIFNETLKTTKGKMMNPAVFMATFFNATRVNISNGLKVSENIFKDGGVVTASKELKKMFAPLAERAKAQYVYDYHNEMVKDIAGKITKLRKPTDAIVNDLKHQMYKHQGMARKIEPDVAAYHQEFAKTAEEAAKKYSSTRIFLAAEDTADFKKYPFMKNIPFTDKEKLTIGRLKRQMSEYRQRLTDMDVPTISGDYMHYNIHPGISSTLLADETGSNLANAWMKNFSRSPNARPLIPDAVEAMSKYIPDVERRIQTQQFWIKDGWDKAMYASRSIEPLYLAFEGLKKGAQLYENTWGTNTARMYTNIEIMKRLFLSPSAGLKHLVKATGDMATIGVGTTIKSMPTSFKGVSHRIIENNPFMKEIAGKLYDPSKYSILKKQLLDSIAPAMDTHSRLLQMGFGEHSDLFSKFNEVLNKVNHVGGMWINLVELYDRGITMEAGLRMAHKHGFTPDQAIYGIYDTILKNNFLGGQFTANWLRNPYIKAALMFQNTPAKIFERRLVNGIRSGRAIKKLGKNIYEATRTAEKRHKLFSDFKNLKADMKMADKELKKNLILDSLTSEVDFYGTAATKQLMRDILIYGAATTAGGAVGVNLSHHFFHLPYMKNTDFGDSYGTLALSPIFQAYQRGTAAYEKKLEDDESSIRAVEIVKKWAGKSGPFPDTVSKFNRISNDDIPDIYQDSAFKYLFAIPAIKEDD